MTKDEILKSASTPMPWGGKAKEREEMRGKPLLTVLFRQPSFFFWVYDATKEGNKWLWLHNEMKNLLYGISLIKPVKKCSCGNQLVNWCLYEGMVTGHYVVCSSKECAYNFGGDNDKIHLIKHSFGYIYRYIKNDDDWKTYIGGFKNDYDLPSKYNYNKYLEWLSQNIII